MGRKIIILLLGLVLCVASIGCESLDIVEQDCDMLVDATFDGLSEVSRQFDEAIHEIRYGY